MVFEKTVSERHSFGFSQAGGTEDARQDGSALCSELDVKKQKTECARLGTESGCPFNPGIPVRAALPSGRDHRVPQRTLPWEQLTGPWPWGTASSNVEPRDLDMRPVF